METSIPGQGINTNGKSGQNICPHSLDASQMLDFIAKLIPYEIFCLSNLNFENQIILAQT